MATGIPPSQGRRSILVCRDAVFINAVSGKINVLCQRHGTPASSQASYQKMLLNLRKRGSIFSPSKSGVYKRSKFIDLGKSQEIRQSLYLRGKPLSALSLRPGGDLGSSILVRGRREAPCQNTPAHLQCLFPDRAAFRPENKPENGHVSVSEKSKSDSATSLQVTSSDSPFLPLGRQMEP